MRTLTESHCGSWIGTKGLSELPSNIGERSLDMLRWGLVPFWAKDLKVGFANINAKAEGIETKPAFREAFQRHRCLVPVDGLVAGSRTQA